MPLYQYKCEECKTVFDKSVPMADSQKTQECPSCDFPSERIVSPIAFVLKGDTWVGKNQKI